MRRRIAAFLPAELLVVRARIDARGRHIGVGRQVARSVEHRVRIAAFLPAEVVEVRERIDASRCDIRIVREIVLRVEAVDRLPNRRMEDAALDQPNWRKCASGSTPAAATSGLCIR